MPKAFTGTLNTNEWFNSMYNAYLLVKTIADGLSGMDNGLASEFKADSDLYHDKFVYTDVNVLNLRDFDPNDTNVLAPEQKGEAKQQEIVVNEAKQVGFTAGNWLEKRAWQDAGSYGQFESVLDAQVGETKRLYEHLMVNTAIGTMESNIGKQQRTVTLPTVTGDVEATNRLQGQTVAEDLANLFVELEDPSTDYTDNGFWKSYKSSDFIVIWNAQFKNKILKIDMPTIFDNAGLKSDFEGRVLPAKYFGKVNAASVTTSGASSNTTIYALEEMDIEDTDKKKYHIKPGMLLPAKVTLSEGGVIKVPSYTVDPSIICKVVHKEGVKYLTTIETSTEFFNSKNLTRNRYLTFAYAYPEYLMGYPIVTVRKAS